MLLEIETRLVQPGGPKDFLVRHLVRLATKVVASRDPGGRTAPVYPASGARRMERRLIGFQGGGVFGPLAGPMTAGLVNFKLVKLQRYVVELSRSVRFKFDLIAGALSEGER